MSETDHDPLIGTLIADRYRIDKRLGQGGMGAVYLAEHVRMHKPFAVKVLHKEMGRLSEAVFRFEREAVAAGRVDHEHLVTATDFGELPDGSMYLVLEYVPGENLASLMAEGRVPVIRALNIARQMAAALSAIHAVGIVHRDVKPDNVMLAPRGGEDFVKLLDFGMAKVLIDAPPEEHQVTRQGLVFGTPRYMAPEQAAGEATDHRADLYALGVILYAMLAGAPPFSADEIRDVLKMQRFDPPPPLPSEVDSGVAALVMTLLAKDPKERVQTADAVVAYIDQLLVRLQAPPPPGPRERALAFLRTRGGAVSAAAAFVVVFGLGLLAVRGLRRFPPAPAASASTSAVRAPSVRAADPGLEAALVRAEVGDVAAWREVEARADGSRTAREWFVLGVARVSHGEVARGLDAYLRASELDRKYGSHPRVLRDLTLAVLREPWEAALRVAAALPGPEGADVLFDVWASTPKATAATQRARELLATDTVRARASVAVRIAFDLRSVQGQSCEVRKPLILRAVTEADSRSFRPLMMLASRTGCGPRNRHDCFPCLRTDDLLDRAIARAHDTFAPDYTRIMAAKP